MDAIFNMDEAGLFYAMKPDRTVVHASESDIRGTKRSKVRMTIAVCSNVYGNRRMKPMVIGKSAKPRAFKNFRVQDYCIYRHNTKAWMTSEIFNEWL